MRVCYQPTLAVPTDWLEVDSQDWHKIAKKKSPIGGEAIDGSPGWVHRLCVQGVEFVGDHYAVRHISDEEIQVVVWNDDPADYPVGQRFATVWTFKNLGPDPRLGGAINTRHSQIIYVDFGEDLHRRWTASGPIENTEFRDWSEFREPNAAIVRHGVWVNDELNVRHETGYTPRGWREWTDGVPADQIIDGRVRQQRPQGRYAIPDGTLTYYQRDTDLVTGVHDTVAVASENELNASAGGGETEASGSLGGGESGLLFCFTTASGEPNSDDWPSGDYRFQLNVDTVGANITYGARTAGTADGHIARVNAGLTSPDLQSWPQTEPLFSSNGTKLGTTGTIDPTSGALGDRYEILIAGTRPASHGNQALTLIFNSDAFADGPWPDVGIEANAVFFGVNF